MTTQVHYLKPILFDEYGSLKTHEIAELVQRRIQEKIDSLRVDGTDKVVALQNRIDGIKRDRNYTKPEKEDIIGKLRKEVDQAKAVEAQHKDEVSRLIADAEAYLKEHFDKDYYQKVKESYDQIGRAHV